MYGRSLCSHAQCYSIVSCAPWILIGAHVLSLEINQLHGHIFLVKNWFCLFLRDHSDSRLSPQPKSFWLGRVCDLVYVMVAIPWKSLLPNGKHLSDAGWAKRIYSMQLLTGAEHFGNVIFRYSELTLQYHFDASIDVNRTWRAHDKTTVSQSGTVAEMYSFKR